VTVRAALDAAAHRIETTLEDQPQLRLTLMRKMSEAYNGLGLWPEARALMEKALAQERTAHGDRSIEVARALEALGNIQDNIGQFQAAGRAFDEALSIRAALGKDRDAEAIDLLSASAKNLRAQLRPPRGCARQSERGAGRRREHRGGSKHRGRGSDDSPAPAARRPARHCSDSGRNREVPPTVTPITPRE
jgi:tetratricopeptide (TPR) repeat protein